ncbi:MAG: hypothetical protein GY898_23355 [Proteobacteria bacterium]|nr:hypothetical protein [Pseudomonadota bacterium]
MRVMLLLVLAAALCGCPDDGRLDPTDDDDAFGGPDDDDSGTSDDDDDDSGTSVDDDDTTPDPCDEPPPTDLCFGICLGYDPVCTDGVWDCSGTPGWEPEEVSCDGFDNDCDGEVDEGSICPDCDYSMPDIEANLHSMWDLDFDFQCNTYLTTNISGPDYTTVVPHEPALDPPTTYYGNANQNMGFALVDPDPTNERVVVTYQCCPSCGCLASNGLTLLYTCDPDDPACGCTGQTNCPGFLDTPFLPTGQLDTSFPFNGWNISTPNGLAVGPRNSYYVGNFRPQTCSDEVGCTACDPDNPGVLCSTDQPNCCDTGTLGRLAQFTLPTSTGVASWRVVAIFEGEEILGLAAGRDTTVLVGTKISASEGRLYRYDPTTDSSTLLATYAGPVYSITQARWTGDWYLAIDAVPEIVRLAEDGTTVLPLPASIPEDPPNMGVLQWAPDGQLYRLIGYGDTTSPLEVYALD